ncbi:phage infection protein [Geobacillus sp. CAMR12739]|nr:phage infection protein [Geobacillus sp. CAMR12739]
MDRLPVAVVNEDQGAKLDGEPMHLGDDVVKRLKEKHSFAWHLFTWIISITFMMIVQFLVTVFDNPGRFLAILLLIAQLVGSAGTYPIELVPGALQSLHPWLPMTHAIRGLRAVISSGDFLVMWKEATILLATAAVFALATLVYFLLRYRRRYAVWTETETAAQT